MSILKLYKDRNKDKKWFEDHAGSATGSHGKMFDLFNTNFRDFKTIFSSFNRFKEIIGIKRSKWPQIRGQEEHKQYVTTMRNTKLFYERKKIVGDREESYFFLTEKGKTFEKIIEGAFSENEKYFLAYSLISDSIISNEKNYLLEKSKEILYVISNENLNDEQIFLGIKEVLKLRTSELKKYMEKDFFFIHSFYDDQDFIINFLNSTKTEKKELREYILLNRSNENFAIDCLAQKYKSGGSASGKTFYSEIYIFYMNLLILKNINKKGRNIFNFLLEEIVKLQDSDFDIKKIKNILRGNKELFFDMYFILDGKSEEDFYKAEQVIVEKDEKPEDTREEYLDETDFGQKMKIKQAFNSLKNIAKKSQEHRCIFDGNINNCQSFTSKSSGKNYLELHHLIPREFRNEFGYSIEVLANYIALCPHCHRKIHLAKDGERKPLITSLHNIRSNRLKSVGLEVTEDNLNKFYKIKE